jgi:hypothetical protein
VIQHSGRPSGYSIAKRNSRALERAQALAEEPSDVEVTTTTSTAGESRASVRVNLVVLAITRKSDGSDLRLP